MQAFHLKSIKMEIFKKRTALIVGLIVFFAFFTLTHLASFYILEESALSTLADMRRGYHEMQSKVEIDSTNGVTSYDTVKTTTNNNHNKNKKRNKNENEKQRIAYAITITKDGNFGDGAAVLAYSIIKQSQQKKSQTQSPIQTQTQTQTLLRSSGSRSDSGSEYEYEYDISFIAFVHPLVKRRDILTRLGYHVIEVPLPINITAIHGTFLKEHINNNGCCGASELIKLASYRLLQYDRVIHMDADTFINNPIDELFVKEKKHEQQHEQQHKQGQEQEVVKKVKTISNTYDKSLLYTTDPNMASHKGIDKMPAQGGFLVMKPSEIDYRQLISTIMTTEFNQGGAWNRSKIGWFWGGMTVQGILPYYYNRVSLINPNPNPDINSDTNTNANVNTNTKKEVKVEASSGSGVGVGAGEGIGPRSGMLDRCIYNTMADSKECLKKNINEIKTAHFTICQKPWTCYKWGGINPANPNPNSVSNSNSSGNKECVMPNCNPLCKDLLQQWFVLRKEAEEFYGIPVVDDACNGNGNGRGNKYIPMALDNAKLPEKDGSGGHSFGKFRIMPIADDSPEIIKPPKPESGYRDDTEEWDNFVGGHKPKPKGTQKLKGKSKGKPKPKSKGNK